jgi:DNA-binding NtrC family response regulator
MNRTGTPPGDTGTAGVLVVDDEALIRWTLAEGLVEQGFVVREAGTGAETRRLLAAWIGTPAAVLLDLRLPDVADLGLLTHIRHLFPDVPVFVMSAHGTPDILAEVMALGARAFIEKPFDLHVVVGQVTAVTGRPDR